MLLQLAVGEVADPDAFRGRLARWTPDVAPGAPGWLGSTGGVTPTGVAVVVIRFASAEAAAAASRRPESVAWWSSLTACLAGPPTVVESEDVTVVEVHDAGHAAGFVQLMRASVADRARFEALEEEMGPAFVALRPDFLAGYRAWLPDGTLAAVDWFRSESEAREGESREMPAALRDQFSEWMSLMGGPEWYDLRHPWQAAPA